MKKFLAIFLTVAMLASFMVVPALAAPAADAKNVTLAVPTNQVKIAAGGTTPTTLTAVVGYTADTVDDGVKVEVTSATGLVTVGAIGQTGLAAAAPGTTSVPVTISFTAGAVTGDDLLVVKVSDLNTPALVHKTATIPVKVEAAGVKVLDNRNEDINTSFVTVSKNADSTFTVVPKNAGTLGGAATWKIDNAASVDGGKVSIDATKSTATKLVLNVNAQATENKVYKITQAGLTIDGTAISTAVDFFVAVSGSSSTVKLTDLKFKAPESTLFVEGETGKFSATKTPSTSNETLYFYSTVPSVIYVDAAGNYNALDAGSARIVVIAENGKTDFIDVSVLEGVTPTSIKISAKTLSNVAVTAYADAEAMAVTTTPFNGSKSSLAWSFVNGTAATELSKVGYTASFGNGGVAFIEASTGKIWVKTPATNASLPSALTVKATAVGYDGKTLSDVALVQVGATVAVNKVELTGPTFNELLVGQSFPISANVKAANDGETPTDKSLAWYSNKPSVLSVDKDGIVTAAAEGTATITAQAHNGVVGTVTIKVVKEVKGTYKVVTSNTLAVRATASSSAIKLDTLKKNDLVSVQEVLGAWSKISFKGTYAYVATSALSDIATGSVTSSTLVVRSSAGGKQITTLKYGETVKILGSYADNPAWLVILHTDNTKAYVAAAHIAQGDLTGVVTAGSLTFRVGASTTSAAYAQKLVKGQSVEIIGKEGSFLKVKTAEGFVGFAAAAYIEVL